MLSKYLSTFIILLYPEELNALIKFSRGLVFTLCFNYFTSTLIRSTNIHHHKVNQKRFHNYAAESQKTSINHSVLHCV
jgi:hypothetical protein